MNNVLERIAENISVRNKAVAHAKKLLDYVGKGSHRQSEAYSAGLYLFVGGEPETAMEAIRYARRENIRMFGPGLKGEMPPSEISEEILESLERNKDKIPEVMQNACKRYAEMLGEYPKDEQVSEGEKANLKATRSLHKEVFNLIFLEESLKNGLSYEDARNSREFLGQAVVSAEKAFNLLNS